MATDATGTPTSLGIRKYNTSVDAPSGLGFNGAMDDIDALLVARTKALTATGDLLFASAPNTPARLPIGATGNVLSVVGGLPAWAASASGASVATTVGGLPAGTAGALGLLRLGSTPFDFLGLTFDTTLNKWVSPVENLGLVTGGSGINSNSSSDARIGSFALGVYGPLVTAGLTFQSRCIGTLTETGTGENGTVSMQVGTQAANAGIGTTGAPSTAYGAVAVTAQNGVNVAFDTGWASPGSPPTSAAQYVLFMLGRTSGTSNAKSWTGTLYTRWVA